MDLILDPVKVWILIAMTPSKSLMDCHCVKFFAKRKEKEVGKT